jgi:hypothetical protein
MDKGFPRWTPRWKIRLVFWLGIPLGFVCVVMGVLCLASLLLLPLGIVLLFVAGIPWGWVAKRSIWNGALRHAATFRSHG